MSQFYFLKLINFTMKELLKEVNELYSQLTEDTKVWMLFCFDGQHLTCYGKKDTCLNCEHRYTPSKKHEEKCPKCKSEEYQSHCKVCDATINADYLGGYLSDKDYEWSETELEKIKQSLLNRAWEKI